MSDDVTWMDFSGAPPILVPEGVLPDWHGFYRPCEPDEDEDLDLGGDLELPDGRAFYVDDEFDFENPTTDYDRVCRYTQPLDRQPVCVMPVGSGEVVAITDYGDSHVGWWPERRMVLTVSRHVPDLSRIPEDAWTHGVDWTIPEGSVRLMHSCEFGTAPAADHFVDLDLDPGRYRVDWYDWTFDYCVMLYRFTKV